MDPRYQRAEADGDPQWTDGAPTFARMWVHGHDALRFHRGKGFTLRVRPDGKPGPKRTLDIVDRYLEPLLDHGELVEVESLADGFKMVFRRIFVESKDLGVRICEDLLTVLGTQYKLGYEPPSGFADCSGDTKWSHGRQGIYLPHNADQQYHEVGPRDGFLWIERSQIQPGDRIFHRREPSGKIPHVSTYLDGQLGGRVIDAEPHDAVAPAGWHRATLGVGTQIRTMIDGYYCDWAHVVAIARIVAINGKP